MADQDLVILAEYHSEMEAKIDVGILQESGIPAEVEGGDTNAALGYAGTVGPLAVRVLVQRQHQLEARTLLLNARSQSKKSVGAWEHRVRSQSSRAIALYLVGCLLVPVGLAIIASLSSDSIVQFVAWIGIAVSPTIGLTWAAITIWRRPRR